MTNGQPNDALTPGQLYGHPFVSVLNLACYHAGKLPRKPHEDDMDAAFRVLVETLAMSLWLYAENTDAPAENHALMVRTISERLSDDTAALSPEPQP